MSWVQIHPRYQEYFHHCGLRFAGDFLRLPGVVLCGHPDRHVVLVNLEPGDSSFGMFLKKEHRVPWCERLVSYRAGFGFVSRSAREARQLELLRQAGIGCPEALAVGEENDQAFLLLREQKGDRDLRAFLAAHPERTCRRDLARRLGVALARMHLAGFAHSELFAKHILVAEDGELCILDWQRARMPHVLTDKERLGDLAALDASLAEMLASRTDRLACLRAYLGELGYPDHGCERAVVVAIVSESRRLSKRARIREQRQACLPRGEQNLIWLDGERLCVTRQLQERYPRQFDEILRRIREPLPAGVQVEQSHLLSTPETTLTLVRRRTSRFWKWLGSLCRRRTFVSPEFEQAATIFRLERHGIRPPRLLGVGQQFVTPWSTVSFLLTEAPDADLSLTRFLEWAHSRERWQLLEQAGRLLRRLHEAGYWAQSLADWAVQGGTVVLTSVAGLMRSRSGFENDLATISRELKSLSSRADLWRFLRAYDEASTCADSLPVARTGRRFAA